MSPTRTAPTTGLTATVDTATGPFTVVTDDTGTVLASGWTADTGTLLPLIAASIRPDVLEPIERQGPGSAAVAAVIAYHNGDLGAIDDIPVRQHSGEFLEHAWDVLRTVKAGTPITYTDYAARSGRPAAVRAAASACARNAAALFVPCHRVLRTDGTLGGFRWGLPVKEWLLAHER
ncbi:methylated-DNA--[protein]-cysteine S-methyltransferase [Nakamurella sp. YIM 132087]|uniref:Methylated-DNA--[protein]-cysteine S-methyltransferase n=1 Tax=Nakamurella alba TaxID=2665158 RepID=A0A7K1FFJ8_9ACTN|nr:methylated-DNA--[protein]-cysteine S-methyltransferase [Nakamurella alba]MTD12882.1 methylated-DNA--[protein]-cysteine S-methyltransferase [Nakamurella alba]